MRKENDDTSNCRRGMASRLCLCAVAAAVLPLASSAREITGLQVAADGAAATVTMTAGEEGDSHALYFAWSNDGADKGADIASWPHVLRVGRVADDATEAAIVIPGAATVSAQYACRAFLAVSEVDYDYLVEGTKSGGSAASTATCFLNTGFKPVGNKTVCVVDCLMNSTKGQQSLFGGNDSSSLSFSSYINGSGSSGGKWAFSCNDGTGKWNMASSLTVSSSQRVIVSLDSTASSAKGVVTVKSTGATYSKTGSNAHTATSAISMVLWGRAGTSSTTCQCLATIYSCVITNDGACVRDFRPAVKGGVAGMWDAQNGNFYSSAGTTAFTAVGTNVTYFVAEGDVVAAASPAWTQAVSDYVTDTPYVESLSLTFTDGGTKGGAAPLTLSGTNDWGGVFTVHEGTLVADFGQGLAATDSLVLKGGAYCPLATSTFTGSFGEGGGAISVVPLADGGTGAGFSAYGHPLEVTLGGNAAVPLQVGPSSSPLFDVPLILNDAYATDTLTLKNGIEGDGSNATFTNIVGAATAVVEGDVSNLALGKLGAGTLMLTGENSLKTLHSAAGTLVLSNNVTTVSGSTVVNSGGALLVKDGATLNIASIRCGGSGAGTLTVDNSTLTSSGTINFGPDSGASTAGTVIVTNGSHVTFTTFKLRNGTCLQYGGEMKITGDIVFGTGYAPDCIYELHGGRFEASSTSTATDAFRLGAGSNSAYPKGYFRVYEGGEAIVRAKYAIFGALTGGVSGDTSTTKGNYGYLQVYGGSFSMLREENDAELRIGQNGFGIMTVTNNGLVYVEGGITASYNPGSTARTSTVGLYKDGIVRARWLRARSNPATYTTTLVIDGATLIAQTNAAVDFVSNFRTGAVGVNGAIIDTERQNITIAQNFAAREGQTWPLDEIENPTGDDLAAAAAFKKAGEGTLTLTGSNTWACATCVSNGTLAASGEFSLPETTTLQLCEGAVLDLCGRTHTVSNLVGSGVVSNGALVVTGAVWPGHPGGVLEFKDATLSASKLSYAFGAGGKCGCLVMDGALDLSGIEITADNLEAKPRGGVAIVRAPSISGTPTSDVALSVSSRVVRIGLAGMRISIR